MPLITQCICESGSFVTMRMNGLRIKKCAACGIIHQDIWMSDSQLHDWYANKYHNGIYQHDYDHDLAVAKKRISAYGKYLKGDVLDIGCGNGAFRDACNAIGIDAYGQDLCSTAADFKNDIGIITKEYQTVTLHDVLEHVPDITMFLNDCRRITKGNLIVDLPDFFAPEGLHHWKKVEHIWLLTKDQLANTMKNAGFKTLKTYNPIPGKIVVIAK